jgi:uncharacterized protein (DUF488 family)
MIIYTIGHSTLELDEFVKTLRHHGILQLVDVRTIPRSHHNPQFNRDTLGPFLRNRRISYRHMKDLGGLRRPVTDSPNTGWRNASFRGFADYMQSPEFSEALEILCSYAQKKPTAIMCAEAVPWRCHRSLIADALLIRGFEVRDIYSRTAIKDHLMTDMAKIEGSRITYPAEAEQTSP